MEFEVFAGVPSETVREVLAIARRRTFGRDEIVFHAGDAANSFHLISKGRFAVRLVTPRGDTALLTVSGPGDVFGEMALIGAVGVRSATVSALEAGETFAVYREEFERLRTAQPTVDRALLAILAERARRLSERVAVAHYLDVDERVRWTLLQLVRVYGNGDTDGVVVPLTQEQIAEFAGAARATVNRVLRDEERRGSITLSRGRVVVERTDEIRRRVRGVPEL